MLLVYIERNSIAHWLSDTVGGSIFHRGRGIWTDMSPEEECLPIQPWWGEIEREPSGIYRMKQRRRRSTRDAADGKGQTDDEEEEIDLVIWSRDRTDYSRPLTLSIKNGSPA